MVSRCQGDPWRSRPAASAHHSDGSWTAGQGAVAQQFVFVLSEDQLGNRGFDRRSKAARLDGRGVVRVQGDQGLDELPAGQRDAQVAEQVICLSYSVAEVRDTT